MLVSRGFDATYILKDRAGNQAKVTADIVGADIATAKTNAATLAASLATVTNALVYSYTIREKFVDDTDTVAPVDCHVEDIASIVANLETSGKTHTFKIPAPIVGIFQGTSGPDLNLVDVQNDTLEAYINNFTNEVLYAGGAGPDAIALVSDGEKVAPDDPNSRPKIVSGKRIHRASRKG